MDTKIEEIRENSWKIRDVLLGVFQGRVRGGFWMDLGRILGGFWRALGGPGGPEWRLK